MDITVVLKKLRPKVKSSEYAVRTDGAGPYIERWTSAEVKPTHDEMQAAWPQAKREHDVAAAWDAIKRERERRKSGGFLVLVGTTEKWFHSDPASRIQHLGLKDNARDVLAAGGTLATVLQIDAKDVLWKTMDGTWVTITGQIAFDIAKSACSLDAQLHQIAEQHKAAMEASADPAAYDFKSAGWPAAFVG